eukprot:g4861.t1
MGAAWGTLLAIDFGLQWACFIVAAMLQTEIFYDISGSLTHIALVLTSLLHNHPLEETDTRQRVLTGMVLAWTTRLGLFLLKRIVKDGKDKRFNKARTKPSLFFIFWTFQAVWVFLIACPVYIVNLKKKSKEDGGWFNWEDDSIGREINWRDYIGWSIWAFGFVVQAVADAQKRSFRKTNPGQFIKHGLWRWSQHPNYVGEILMWSGIALSSSSCFENKFEFCAGLFSPLVTTYLLTRVSGIPMLDRIAKKKWGENKEWLKYRRETPVLVFW